MTEPLQPERPSRETIVTAIERLLSQRADGATICPSEVARTLAQADESWRALMPDVRLAAAWLVEQGRLRVTQRGRVVDPLDANGPIRLGRPR